MTELEKANFKLSAAAAEIEYYKSLLVKEAPISLKAKVKNAIKSLLPQQKKTKIGLVVDVDNWAFYNIANNFSKHLTEFECLIVPMSLLESDFLKMWLLLKDCEIVHFFCRGIPLSIKNPSLRAEIEKYGDTYDHFYQKYLKGKILTTCVYDHLFLESDFDFTQYLCSEVQQYYVSSNILYDIYQHLDIKYKPSAVITDGINLDLFYPKNIQRLDRMDRPLVVGWVGNSAWSPGNDHKGLHTIIKPAIENLQKAGYSIELLSSDKLDKHIPIEEMVNYYEKIDVYVCASINEGTPNPVLEAMACGIPVISTNVGIVKDAFGPVQQQFLLEERSVACLEAALKKLMESPELMHDCSKENLESIKSWSWEYKAKDFEKFIKNSITKGVRL